MLNRIIRLFVISIIFICLLGITASAQNTTYTLSENEFDYLINETENFAILTEYSGNDPIVHIPDKINGYPVLATLKTFKNNNTIEKVIFPEGIVTIGKETFFGCKNLKQVILSDTIEVLEEYAFAYSSIPRLTLTKNLRHVKYGCFYKCKDLTYIKTEATIQENSEHSVYFYEYSFYDSGIKVLLVAKDGYVAQYENAFNSNFLATKSHIEAFVHSFKLTQILQNWKNSGNSFLWYMQHIIYCFFVLMVILIIYIIIHKIKKVSGNNTIDKINGYYNNLNEQIKDNPHKYIFLPRQSSFLLFVFKISLTIFFILSIVVIWVFGEIYLTDIFYNSASQFQLKYLLPFIYITASILSLIILLLLVISLICIIQKKYTRKKHIHIQVKKVGKFKNDK